MPVRGRRAVERGAGAARRRSDSVSEGQGGGGGRRARAGPPEAPGRGPQTGGAVRGVDAAEPCRRAASGPLTGVVARREPAVGRGVVGLVLLARAVAAAAHARQGGRAPPRAAPAAERWGRGRVVSLSGSLILLTIVLLLTSPSPSPSPCQCRRKCRPATCAANSTLLSRSSRQRQRYSCTS